MTETLRAAIYGVGSIGAAVARACRARGMDLVAAVDVDPAKLGRDLGDVAGLGQDLGVPVARDLREALPRGEGDVLFHCATSYLWEAHPQLAEAALTACDVVSTCEELSYPWRAHRHLAQEVDQAARREGITILGTGVNPGFVMDALVVALSSMCTEVTEVRAQRIVDAALRRRPLQEKVGAGLTEAAFRERAKEGNLGHVGTYESMDLIAAAFGWNLSGAHVEIEPVLAETSVASADISVAEGRVAGLHQVGRGLRAGKEVILLDLQMFLGAEAKDVVQLRGVPDLDVEIPGGVAGDDATVAALVNGVPHVLEAAPGLRTMLDMPLPSYVENVWRRR